MGLGTCIKQNFKVIRDNPITVVNDFGLDVLNRDCCFILNVLAQTVGSDPFKNDMSSVIFFYSNAFTGASMVLEKLVNGEWEEVETLDNNEYGTLYEYGFKENSKEEKLMGYVLEWQLVLQDLDLGEGSYRIKTIEQNILSEEETNQYSMQFCLKEYTPARADGTVRIDYWHTGIMGDLADDKKTKDYDDLTWFNEIRLPDSIFGYNKSSYEETHVRYENGRQVYLKDDQVQSYTLKTGRLPSLIHDILRSDILQAEQMAVTDYNSVNPVKHENRYVRKSSGYEPAWNTGTLLASVQIDFIQEYQNFRHKRC